MIEHYNSAAEMTLPVCWLHTNIHTRSKHDGKRRQSIDIETEMAEQEEHTKELMAIVKMKW